MTAKEELIKKIANTMILKSPKRIDNEDEKFLVFEECVLALSDLSEEQLQEGRVKYSRLQNSFGIDTGKFRELCLSGDGAMDLNSKSFKVWNMVHKLVSSHGRTQNPYFKDSRISQTIRMLGGWLWICGQDTDQLNTFVKNDFVKIYKSLAHINQKFDPLLNGEFKAPPRLIGYDPKEKEKVLQEIEAASKVGKKMIGNLAKKMIKTYKN